MKKELQDRIFKFFITSHDFNGLSLWSLPDEFGNSIETIIEVLKELVREQKISIQSSTNPHIIGFQHYDIESQIEILEDAKTIQVRTQQIGELTLQFPDTEYPICLYPSKDLLLQQRDVNEIKDAPYTLQLALAEPQLKPIFFEIEVLDRYFHDPRYDFRFDDYSGSIYTSYDENREPILREEDRVFIKTFGLGIDSEHNRLAVVYLRYLHDLTKEHQIFWKSKESRSPAKVLKEYYENTILGNWSFSHSIFSGLIGELTAINTLSKAIFNKPVFIKDFEKEKRPKEFTFFFIPTLKNYNEFVLLLDKLLSDNINKNFFTGYIELFEFQEVKPGIVERRAKGTLALFEEWLLLQYTIENTELIKAIFKHLDIRRERQSPAHKINENKFDKQYTEMQREMVNKAYASLRAVREIFQQHPKAYNTEIPKWLDEGNIKIF